MILDSTNSSDITVREGLQELDKWKPALTEDQWKRANLVVIDEQAPDDLSCTLSATGKFKVSDYVEKFRIKHSKKQWADMIWNKATSPRVNAFIWKVYRRAISVDINIQRRGIPFTSRCVCCHNPKLRRWITSWLIRIWLEVYGITLLINSINRVAPSRLCSCIIRGFMGFLKGRRWA